MIVLHIGRKAKRVEAYILLAHEFAHYLDYWTTSPRWRRERRAHGDRFQILLWKLLKRAFWRRAGSGHWVEGPSAHDIRFQISPEIAVPSAADAQSEAAFEALVDESQRLGLYDELPLEQAQSALPA